MEILFNRKFFVFKWKACEMIRKTNQKLLHHRVPRFDPNDFGKHAEHCAAISVEGWQITVPIGVTTERFNLRSEKRRREIEINCFSQLPATLSTSKQSFPVFVANTFSKQRKNFALPTLNGTRKLCAKELIESRSLGRLDEMLLFLAMNNIIYSMQLINKAMSEMFRLCLFYLRERPLTERMWKRLMTREEEQESFTFTASKNVAVTLNSVRSKVNKQRQQMDQGCAFAKAKNSIRFVVSIYSLFFLLAACINFVLQAIELNVLHVQWRDYKF